LEGEGENVSGGIDLVKESILKKYFQIQQKAHKIAKKKDDFLIN